MVNGTVTMEVALRAMNSDRGNEVILPAYTFQATAAAVMQAGAIPIIVDVDFDTYCIDPKAIEAAISQKSKAIIPVHNEGIPSDEGYEAMHHYSLFQPGLSTLPGPFAFPEYFKFDKMSFPVAEQASEAEAI